MSWLPDAPTVAAAGFTVLRGRGRRAEFAVQFNPASLEYTLSNEFDPRNGNNGARQFVKKTSAKLTMTLIFDTTTTGGSVRDVTANMAGLLEPARDGSRRVAPKVEFAWGTYRFQGVIEQYKETIDFFSTDGVPLRSSINLTLASQEVEFQSNRSPSPSVDRQRPEPLVVPPGQAPSNVADQAAEPRAARAIAFSSAADSLRMAASASLAIGGEVSLGAAAGFATGAGAGFGVGVGVGVGGAAFGAGANLGAVLQATAGAAFTGLRQSTVASTISVQAARAALLPPPTVPAGASFGPGGRALVGAGASLSADVGVGPSARGRIGFGE